MRNPNWNLLADNTVRVVAPRPAHHTVEEYIDAYLAAGDLQVQKETPLFRTTVGRSRKLTENGLQRQEALAMIRVVAK